MTLDDEVITTFRSEPGRIPRNQRELATDAELAQIAVQTAFERHVGRIEIVYGPMGEMLTQVGKDLSRVTKVVGTGGPIAFSSCPEKILSGVIPDSDEVRLLKPRETDFYIDEKYVMFALGLLARSEPQKALRMMKKYLKPIKTYWGNHPEKNNLIRIH
jgi:uncharacterized protein (TIGR01319 family)